MPVDIEAVLALLPELFPGVQQIPLKNIRPNPDNPGPPITDQTIQDLADNLAVRGLVNPIKLQPDRANPLVEGVRVHPDNPRITAEGRPWELRDFRFMILTGDCRYRAAGRLQWATIAGYILNPTPGEAVEITHLDNDIRKRGWWADYQALELRIKADPNLTQGQVGTRLKMDRSRVNEALSLLPLLNTQARGLISGNSTFQNKGIRGISESAALRLADLGPGLGLKRGVGKKDAPEEERRALWPYPPIPPETRELVRRALEVAIDQEMIEAGVKGLVGWVKAGNEPETYSISGRSEKEEEENQAPSSHPSPLKGEGENRSAPQSPGEPGGFDSQRWVRQAHHGSPTAGGAQTGPAHLLQALIEKVGLDQSGWSAGVKSFLMGNLKRAMGNLTRRGMVKGLVGMGAIVILAPHLFVHLTSVGRPQSAVGGQKKENGPDPSRESGEAIGEHSEEALKFARDFYATEYLNTSHWMGHLNSQLAKGYSEVFFRDFCPPERIVDINTRKLRGEFYATAPVKFLGMDKDGEDYLVQGKVTLMSDLKDYGVTLTEGPVELEVHLVHEDGNVCMVKERLQLPSTVVSPQSAAKAQDKSAVVSPQSAVKAQDKPAVRSPRLAAGEKKKAQANSTSKQSAQGADSPTAEATSRGQALGSADSKGESASTESAHPKRDPRLVASDQGDILTNAVSQAADTAAKKTGDDLGNAVGKAFGF